MYIDNECETKNILIIWDTFTKLRYFITTLNYLSCKIFLYKLVSIKP